MFFHPWYAAIVVLHVVSAVIGFGAIGMTGSYAARVRRSPDPFDSEAIRRYFRPGRNGAAFALYLVPVFGGLALWFSGDAHRLYPYLGAAIWLISIVVVNLAVLPAESRIQRLVATSPPPADARGHETLVREARRCERGAAVTSLLFVLALVVMIAQP